ncbi:CoA transferase, partial [Alphaproteobacteria bacterium]|nr:CoA transferase [Alphaproteobacteria bacterium]
MYDPLKGIKVIDFTHVLAGPACSYYLGLLGADVIKIESVTKGDAMRYRGGTSEIGNLTGMSTSFLTQAAGKRSIALNVASKEGFKIFEKLLKNADVLVENHKPTTLNKLGINSDYISRVNDKLIHCALTGYGRKGEKENAAAYDVNIQAISGIMNLTGYEGQGPIRTGAPIIDYGVALAASFAISSALFKRTQTGIGSFIDVSMLETAYTLMSSTIVDYFYTGNEPKQRGNAANSKSPASGSFECKKGKISLGVNEEHQFRALAKMLKKEDWLKDKKFSDKKSRKENELYLLKQLEFILKSKTANQWEKLAIKFGVPAARVLSLKESLKLKQNQSRSFIHEFKNEKLKVLTLPFRYNHQSNHAPTNPPTRLGENTLEI